MVNKLVHTNLSKAQHRQEKNYKTNEIFEYEVGQHVLLSNEQMKTGQTKKFVPKYIGPFVILEKRELVYQIKDPHSGKIQRVHYNRLKPYHRLDAETSFPY